MTETIDLNAARIAREDAALIADGYEIPREGTVIPTRSEIAALLQEIVEDAGGSVAQPLAERFAQYLDAIYAPSLTPAGAVTAFAGWLTCRDEPVTMSSRHDAAGPADLVSRFNDSQGFPELAHDWHTHIKPYPKG